MRNDPIPPGQANRLALPLDALAGVTLSDAKRASLTWLAGFERCTAENIAAVTTRARQAREGDQQPDARTPECSTPG